MILTNGFGALLIAAVIAIGSNQNRVDFSGKWSQIDPESSTPATMIVTQDTERIEIGWPAPAGTVGRLSLNLDGSVTRIRFAATDGMIVERAVTAKPDGNRLQIDMKQTSPVHGAYTIEQIWSLQGDVLVIRGRAISDRTRAEVAEPTSMTFRRN